VSLTDYSSLSTRLHASASAPHSTHISTHVDISVEQSVISLYGYTHV